MKNSELQVITELYEEFIKELEFSFGESWINVNKRNFKGQQKAIAKLLQTDGGGLNKLLTIPTQVRLNNGKQPKEVAFNNAIKLVKIYNNGIRKGISNVKKEERKKELKDYLKLFLFTIPILALPLLALRYQNISLSGENKKLAETNSDLEKQVKFHETLYNLRDENSFMNLKQVKFIMERHGNKLNEEFVELGIDMQNKIKERYDKGNPTPKEIQAWDDHIVRTVKNIIVKGRLKIERKGYKTRSGVLISEIMDCLWKIDNMIQVTIEPVKNKILNPRYQQNLLKDEIETVSKNMQGAHWEEVAEIAEYKECFEEFCPN